MIVEIVKYYKLICKNLWVLKNFVIVSKVLFLDALSITTIYHSPRFSKRFYVDILTFDIIYKDNPEFITPARINMSETTAIVAVALAIF